MNYRQAANLMIKKHGRNARQLAMKRAAELRAKGELATAAIWVKVSDEVAAQQAALDGGIRVLMGL
ncbi:hypothetical protein HN018_24835 (plasmid) [Lichenicola cladoniae]|uniref:Uncharacterized protein n=1 Tax=Lichenicola cladoniae TaxID=1484109 RepID=A0A6M8HWX0_9PROT|nr:hypothetical protein [Lichenicola cladoniae]NPD70110.1 hypothetical protein [Acetobacteraceae bacterium]NPD70112.1 hypothetical protein [Acetobacteraceae bacterium]QKE92902.1 hypothetical protein HN018_21995 [Lichenicola cladoniae]QKE93417.1 hypothetical protein HN018_24835 [Lichenicola cladoniae]